MEGLQGTFGMAGEMDNEIHGYEGKDIKMDRAGGL